MNIFNKLIGVFALVSVALIGNNAFCGSELDPVAVPMGVVRQLDPVTETVTDYRVDSLDLSVLPQALEGLSPAERKVRLDSFIKKVVKPANKVAEEQVGRVSSELDTEGPTSANHGHWRWRGHHTGHYYGGYNYNYYYNNYRYNYQPYWGYNYNYSYYYQGGYGCYGPNYYASPYYTYYSRW